MLNGEIVIVKSDGLDFDELQLRLHPAASRVRLLSARNPASVVFFDLLCHGADDLREMKFQVRRERLVKLLSSAAPPLILRRRRRICRWLPIGFGALKVQGWMA